MLLLVRLQTVTIGFQTKGTIALATVAGFMSSTLNELLICWLGRLISTSAGRFELKNAAGNKIVDLYFKPITRADRKRAQSFANSVEALDISTQMLCQIAELEDGTKAFASADAPKLQRELPESVLNDLELFLFGLG